MSYNAEVIESQDGRGVRWGCGWTGLASCRTEVSPTEEVHAGQWEEHSQPFKAVSIGTLVG